MRKFLMIVLLVIGVSTNMQADSIPISIGEHTVIIDGISLYYTVRGQGPILLVGHPSAGGTGYRLTLQVMEQFFTVVYYDNRGTGRSAAPSKVESYQLAGQVQELYLLQQYLGMDKVWLFGHSDQGLLALAYTAKYPSLVSGMILTGVSDLLSLEDRMEVRA